MNEDHLSDRTVGLDDRTSSAADGPDVTRADQTSSPGAAPGCEESDRAGRRCERIGSDPRG